MVARLGCEAVKLAVPIRIDLKFGRTWGDATHIGRNCGRTHNGGTQHNETLAAPPAIESRSPVQQAAIEATTQIDPPDSNGQPVPPHCLGGDTEPDGEPHAPAKVTGTTTARRRRTTPARRSTRTGLGDVLRDEFAASLQHGFLTLPQIAACIRATTAKQRAVAAAQAATVRRQGTDKNCLRHDANVLEISGIEGEHDKGTLRSPMRSRRLRKAGIRCLLYTSPSYVPGDQGTLAGSGAAVAIHAPSLRVGLVARLNGILERRARGRELHAVTAVLLRQRRQQPEPPGRCSTATSSICATIWWRARSSRTAVGPAITPPAATPKARQRREEGFRALGRSRR